MKNTFSKWLAVVAMGAVSAVAITDAPNADAQVVVTVAPPVPYIATTEPVYYEGRPHYWYGNRWYYRDEHNGWAYRQSEPAYLAEHRRHAPPVRHYYGHGGHGHR